MKEYSAIKIMHGIFGYVLFLGLSMLYYPFIIPFLQLENELLAVCGSLCGLVKNYILAASCLA